jgi:hypothetical protein
MKSYLIGDSAKTRRNSAQAGRVFLFAKSVVLET